MFLLTVSVQQAIRFLVRQSAAGTQFHSVRRGESSISPEQLPSLCTLTLLCPRERRSVCSSGRGPADCSEMPEKNPETLLRPGWPTSPPPAAAAPAGPQRKWATASAPSRRAAPPLLWCLRPPRLCRIWHSSPPLGPAPPPGYRWSRRASAAGGSLLPVESPRGLSPRAGGLKWTLPLSLSTDAPSPGRPAVSPPPPLQNRETPGPTVLPAANTSFEKVILWQCCLNN